MAHGLKLYADMLARLLFAAVALCVLGALPEQRPPTVPASRTTAGVAGPTWRPRAPATGASSPAVRGAPRAWRRELPRAATDFAIPRIER